MSSQTNVVSTFLGKMHDALTVAFIAGCSCGGKSNPNWRSGHSENCSARYFGKLIEELEAFQVAESRPDSQSTDDDRKEKEVVPHDCPQEKENKRLLAEAMGHPGVRDVEEVFGVVHPDTERHQLERADWIRERNQLRTILEALPADNIIGTPNTEPASLEWFAEKFGYRCGFPALVEMLRKYAALRRQYTKPLIELYSKLGRIIPPRKPAMSDTDKKE